MLNKELLLSGTSSAFSWTDTLWYRALGELTEQLYSGPSDTPKFILLLTADAPLNFNDITGIAEEASDIATYDWEYVDENGPNAGKLTSVPANYLCVGFYVTNPGNGFRVGVRPGASYGGESILGNIVEKYSEYIPTTLPRLIGNYPYVAPYRGYRRHSEIQGTDLLLFERRTTTTETSSPSPLDGSSYPRR